MTISSPRIVRVRVRPVGINFGFSGEIVARNGRVITSTGAVGSQSGARVLAEDLCIKNGWTIAEPRS